MPKPGRAERGAGSLWRSPDFLRLWAGQTASLTGSAVSYIALPLAGIVLLRLGPAQVGALASANAIPAAVVAPFLGTIVDRIPRRRLCVACDAARAIGLGSVPAAAALGVLSYWQLVAVSALLGSATALFNVAHQAFLPEVVPAASLGSANGKLQASQSATEVAGTGLATWLMRLGGPAAGVAADAVSYVISAGFLLRIRLPAGAVAGDGPVCGRGVDGHARGIRGFLTGTREGFTLLWRDSLLRPLSVSYAVLVLFSQVQESVYMLFLVHGARFTVTTIGVVFTISGIIGFGAAAASDWLTGRLGTGPLVVTGQLAIVAGGILLACVSGPTVVAAAIMLAGETCFGVGLSFYGVGSRTLFQTRTAASVRGRVIGASRVLPRWCTAAAGLLGGSAAAALGLRGTLALGAIGMVLALALILRPRVWAAGR